MLFVSPLYCVEREEGFGEKEREFSRVFGNAGLCERKLAKARTQSPRGKDSLCYKLQVSYLYNFMPAL